MIEVFSQGTDKGKKEAYSWLRPRAYLGPYHDDFSYITFKEEEKILAVLLFSDYDGHNIFVHLAIEDPRVCQRRYIKLMFEYCFLQAKCERMTATCVNGYERNEKLLAKTGFVKEGVIRSMMKTANGHVDAALYGMLKGECRWV
jgi:RimJ/RimL family protein N-acetyltransferase|tara:strand:+ start:192 stop:623 length:432 start_codon:yes stop_codon:yes gene_type:complete